LQIHLREKGGSQAALLAFWLRNSGFGKKAGEIELTLLESAPAENLRVTRLESTLTI
jgi:hypothetical protein